MIQDLPLVQLMHDRRRELKICVISAVAFFLAAYAFRYFNTSFSHDTLEIVFEDSNVRWQIALGRWLQPIIWVLRGRVNAPWLIGCIAIPLSAFACWLLVDLLHVRSSLGIALVVGTIATAPSLTVSHASFVSWVDMYAISLLCVVFAAWLCVRSRFWLAGSIPLLVSLAIYQAYLQFYIGTVVLVALALCVRNEPLEDLRSLVIKSVLVAVVGLILYYVSVKVACSYTGIKLTDSYNGIKDAGTFTGPQEVLKLIGDAWKYPFVWYLAKYGRIKLVVLGLGALCALYCCIKLLAKTSMLKRILFALILVLLPLALSCEYVISKGMLHDLMVHSYSLAPVLAIALVEWYSQSKDAEPNEVGHLKPLPAVALCLAFVMASLFLNIRFANQTMVRKQLEYEATQSTMTRVIDRIETTEGYQPGVTRVAWIGSPNQSVMEKREEYDTTAWACQTDPSSVTYYKTVGWYFRHMLSYDIKLMSKQESSDMSQTPEVQQMGVFPAKDSVRMVGDVLVVKLGDKALVN